MCGIAGHVRWGGPEILRRMTAVLAHRGPDGEGFHEDPHAGVGLGHRRLSIIDLEGGAQPMPSYERDAWVVFNGEIFNAPELRRELENQGARFATHHSDTEVLLQLYRRDGPRAVDRLNGMFAFVIHDPKRGVLFGARDPLGIKPLFYAHQGRRFAFASELVALEQLPDWDRSIDPQSAFDYFTFDAIPAPATIWRAARKVPAGHAFTYRLETGDLQIDRYWSPPLGTRSGVSTDRSNAVAQVRHHALTAVQRWALSDVPVACSLSGGLDSAFVVAALARDSSVRVPTFTLGFHDEPDLDETPLARAVADRWNTDHHEIRIGCDDLLRDLPQMTARLGEPYSGGLPSWFVFHAMAREFKVAMTGTGGDELFGNYGKAHPALDAPRLGRARWRHVRRGGSWSDALRSPHATLLYPGLFDREKRSGLFQSGFARDLDSSLQNLEHRWRDSRCPDPRDAVAAVDLQVQLPEEFLAMTDRFSMAHSLEARTPLLDRALVEYVLSLPAGVRCGRPVLKQLLLDAVGDLFPPALLAARKKGFVLPVARWLRGPLRPHLERLTRPGLLAAQGIFRPDCGQRHVHPHLEGRRDTSRSAWKLLHFQLWAESKGLLPGA